MKNIVLGILFVMLGHLILLRYIISINDFFIGANFNVITNYTDGPLEAPFVLIFMCIFGAIVGCICNFSNMVRNQRLVYSLLCGFFLVIFFWCATLLMIHFGALPESVFPEKYFDNYDIKLPRLRNELMTLSTPVFFILGYTIRYFWK